jgi:hypothetical protein
MPLRDDDYRDLLESTRRAVRRAGLGSLDERILSEIRNTEGPFDDLTRYLKLLIVEMSLGSDTQLRAALHRVREAAHTESGRPIEGFRVQLSPEESRMYRTDSFDLVPAPGIQQLLSELRTVLDELYADRNADRNT